MIEFNTKEGSKNRQKTKPLTLKQEEQVVAIINDLLKPGFKVKASKEKIKLLQRMINHYQNLNHYRAYTEGLWATNKFSAVTVTKDMFFKLKF